MPTTATCWRPTAVLVAAVASIAAGDGGAQTAVDRLLQRPPVRAAVDFAKASEPQTIADQIRFCQIAAPTFAEGTRAEALRRTFEALGLEHVRLDAVGNVLADRPGRSRHPHLVMAAHLDTVFPAGTNVTVRREGPVLRAPGIGDDSRGLAELVAVARALAHGRVQTTGSITFVANVGEEGLGDLRGVKQLFNETLKGEVDRFVSLDGTGPGVSRVAVGSHRYRVVFSGPGGHSFGAFGTPSPIHAQGRAIAKIAELQVPREPKTTFNVGRVGGGQSVNSIAAEAWMEVDVRSSDSAALASLDARLRTAVEAAVREENRRWGRRGVVTARLELAGDRPTGSTPRDSLIVRTTESVNRALRLPTLFSDGSTDANTPMSLHIPAIAVGTGGRGSDAHALTESFDTTGAWQGTERAVLLAVALTEPD